MTPSSESKTKITLKWVGCFLAWTALGGAIFVIFSLFGDRTRPFETEQKNRVSVKIETEIPVVEEVPSANATVLFSPAWEAAFSSGDVGCKLGRKRYVWRPCGFGSNVLRELYEMLPYSIRYKMPILLIRSITISPTILCDSYHTLLSILCSKSVHRDSIVFTLDVVFFLNVFSDEVAWIILSIILQYTISFFIFCW